jgi:hypothetical protein
MIGAEHVCFLLAKPAQLAYMEFRVFAMVSIGQAIRRSATLLQFQGMGHRLAAIHELASW